MSIIGSNTCSLYFHIPFCSKKCHYCHFYVIPDNSKDKKILVDSFSREWRLRLPLLADKEITSIYFGGGTPSLLGADYLSDILNWIFQSTDAARTCHEITLEANPEEINFALMHAYNQAGVNRVSIGLQSLSDPLLKTLGRLHNSHKAIESVYLTREAGINNITVDLMYDLPQQTLEMWTDTLNKAVVLPITHLSLYNLTIEPQTLFYKQEKILRPHLPSPEVSLAMYNMAKETLEKVGLEQYEISAFAKTGYRSHHNIGYWTARPFLGFGPSAFSYWSGKRFSNIANLRKYSEMLQADQLPIDFEEELPKEKRQRELLAVRVRLLEGVDMVEFQKKEGELSKKIMDTLESLIIKGFLRKKGSNISLTRKGILFYDTVATELV